MKSPMWLRRWQVLGLLSIVALMAMVIVACGGDDDEETATPAATAAPAATQPPAPAATQPPAPAATQPPAPAATQPPAPAATQPPAPAAPQPTAMMTPTRQIFVPEVTATPAPTTEAVMMDRDPVQPRLRVSMSPPGVQARTHWELGGWQSAQGPLYSIYETLIHLDRYTQRNTFHTWPTAGTSAPMRRNGPTA